MTVYGRRRNGRHRDPNQFKEEEVSVWRWMQLVVGAVLTYGGAILCMESWADKEPNAGDTAAPLVFLVGGVMFIAGITMLVTLLGYLLSGYKGK